MRFLLILIVGGLLTSQLEAEDPIFSGPQRGEDLTPFQAQVVLGDDAGKRVDVVGADRKTPLLLIFVHRVTRPSLGLTRLLVDFAGNKEKAGIETKLVFLTEDVTESEAWVRRARHAMPEGVTPLVSTEGAEGPGSYGLNRSVTLTVLVGDKGKVAANFALIQPSIQADATKIGHAVVKVLGSTKAPTLKEMGYENRAMQAMDLTYRRMMAPVIQKSATQKQVDKAAQAVEQMAAENKAFRQRVHGAASRIVQSGRLSSYGTERAQEYLAKWAEEFAPGGKQRDKPGQEQAAETKSSLTDAEVEEEESADSDE